MNDLISRQAAIDAINSHFGFNTEEEYGSAVQEVINGLPPAQQDENKYEYHYDHTDCIWYRPEARNRCPATCAQYRDGRNGIRSARYVRRILRYSFMRRIIKDESY